jgi:hypothetical protein
MSYPTMLSARSRTTIMRAMKSVVAYEEARLELLRAGVTDSSPQYEVAAMTRQHDYVESLRRAIGELADA